MMLKEFKFTIFIFFLLALLILVHSSILGTEYTIEEGQCYQDSDCQSQGCKSVSCIDYQCVYANEPAGTSCDDGLYCTASDSCSGGVCQSGSPRDCSSLDDQCNQGVCNEDSDECQKQNINENQSCDDGLICTENDICLLGVCQGQTTNPDCLSGVCGDGLINSGEGCDDNNIISGDGCSSSCQPESNYTCVGEPSVCVQPTLAGGGGGGGAGGGGGGGGGDIIPPVISSIEVLAESNSATITWKTDESSISWVVYGETVSYGKEKKTTEYISSHSLEVTGLSADTSYHFKIKSKDQFGNTASYTDQIFKTLKTGEIITGGKDVKDMTIEELKKRIAEILALIAELKAKLALLRGEKFAGIPVDFRFETNLKYGQSLEDVKYLQIFLNSFADTQVAYSGWGSSGKETVYFGSLTEKAAIKFQEKYSQEILAPLGLANGTGFVGSSTRAKLNELLGR